MGDEASMLATVRTAAKWLDGTAASETLKAATWLIPTLQTVHIVCVAMVIAATVLVSLRILGVFEKSEPLAAICRRFLPWIWYALGILLVTGALLILAEPGRSLLSPAFGLKMLMLTVVIVLTACLQYPLAAQPGFWHASLPRRVGAAGIAILSLALWPCIVFAGRWIAYMGSV